MARFNTREHCRPEDDPRYNSRLPPERRNKWDYPFFCSSSSGRTPAQRARRIRGQAGRRRNRRWRACVSRRTSRLNRSASARGPACAPCPSRDRRCLGMSSRGGILSSRWVAAIRLARVSCASTLGHRKRVVVHSRTWPLYAFAPGTGRIRGSRLTQVSQPRSTAQVPSRAALCPSV